MARAPKRRRRFRWRRWNNIIHRDMGYFCVALTLVYAISGIAVNHVADWNPSYQIERRAMTFDPIEISDRETMVAELIARLDLPPDPVDAFRPSPGVVEIFYPGFSIEAQATRGEALRVRRAKRTGFYEVNALHLNVPKGIWTLLADAYAVMLALLAITGIFVLKGSKGLSGRGKWWIALGFLVPVLGFYLLTSAA